MKVDLTQFLVRPMIHPVSNGVVFIVVCETCGFELPIGALNMIDRDAVGFVMMQHLDELGQCSQRTL